MKKLFAKFQSALQREKATKNTPTRPAVLQRQELERQAIKGAKKAVKEYGQVFERLAQYDKA